MNDTVREAVTTIELSPHNLLMAGMVGISRQVKNLSRGVRDRYGCDSSQWGWQNHCNGACGELAFAKWKGKYWDGAMNDFAAPDVGAYQVRTSAKANQSLILHPGDSDDDLFVLVLVHALPICTLAGWIPGGAGKHGKWWTTEGVRHPAFFVPQSALLPMEQLP